MSAKSLAVLVDGENVSPKHAEEILLKAGTLGDVTFRLVFGDFRRKNTPLWGTPIVEAFRYDLVQTTREYRGSNSADNAIISRARQIAREGAADAVCVVSCDGDFAPLARELIEAGVPCYAMGTNNTSKRLINACQRFLRLGEQQQEDLPEDFGKPQIRLLRLAVANHANKQGWAKLRAVDDFLRSHSAVYRQTRWGFSRVSKLVQAAGLFELQVFPDNHTRVRLAE